MGNKKNRSIGNITKCPTLTYTNSYVFLRYSKLKEAIFEGFCRLTKFANNIVNQFEGNKAIICSKTRISGIGGKVSRLFDNRIRADCNKMRDLIKTARRGLNDGIEIKQCASVSCEIKWTRCRL